MKNEKIKTKATKIVARVMLIVLLITSVFTLTACPGYNQRFYSTACYSYDEMLEFANKHKQTFNDDYCVFFLFDIDRYTNITLEEYYVGTTWLVHGLDCYKPINKLETPDDHFPCDVRCTFKMDAIIENGQNTKDAYRICCIDYYVGDEILESDLSVISSHINEIDFIDSTRYVSEYFICVEENIGMNISITHQHKATQEELDAIVQIFLDNLCVIK